jgi:hypothetical protein
MTSTLRASAMRRGLSTAAGVNWSTNVPLTSAACGEERRSGVPQTDVVGVESRAVSVACRMRHHSSCERFTHIVGAAMARQQQEFLAQFAPIERLLGRALEVGDAAREHAAVVERDRDGRGQRGRAVLGDRDRQVLGERADLRLAQRAFVEGTR